LESVYLGADRSPLYAVLAGPTEVALKTFRARAGAHARTAFRARDLRRLEGVFNQVRSAVVSVGTLGGRLSIVIFAVIESGRVGRTAFDAVPDPVSDSSVRRLRGVESDVVCRGRLVVRDAFRPLVLIVDPLIGFVVRVDSSVVAVLAEDVCWFSVALELSIWTVLSEGTVEQEPSEEGEERVVIKAVQVVRAP